MIYLSLAITNNPNAIDISTKYQKFYEATTNEEIFNPATAFLDSDLTEFEIMMSELRILKECSKMIILPYSNDSDGVKLEIAFCRKFNIPMHHAKKLKSDLLSFDRNRYLRLSQNNILEFLELTANELQTNEYDLIHSRERDIMDVRHIITRILRLYGFNFTMIGKILDKHHSSILNSNTVFENLYSQSLQFRKLYNYYQNKFSNFIKQYNKAA